MRNIYGHKNLEENNDANASELPLANKLHPPRPLIRDGYWYLIRRVPLAFSPYDRRRLVKLSTGIPVAHDPRAILARQRVNALDEKLQAFWSALAAGRDPQLARVILKAETLQPQANLHPVAYDDLMLQGARALISRIKVMTNGQPVTDLLERDQENTLAKMVMVTGSPDETRKTEGDDRLRVSQMIEECERIKATYLAQKSPAQLKRWKEHRQTNLDLFLQIIGRDLLLSDLTSKHTRAFRRHFKTRVRNGEIEIASANRAMSTVTGLYKAISDFHDFEQKTPFANMRIPGGLKGKRIAYDPDFIQNQFLAEGVFDSINAESRCIIYLIVETGLRLSEACALTENTIHLDGPIPYVEVMEENRMVKTKSSIRTVPLVGVALMAMQAHPKGFPRYYDKPDSASGQIYNALNRRKLITAKGETLYSLRHSLTDRLKAAEAPGDIQDDIMGHIDMYGKGTTLEHRHRWLSKIAFRPPSRV